MSKVAVFTVTVEDAFPNGDDARLDAICDALDDNPLLATAVESLESALREQFGNHVSVRLVE